MFSSLSYKDKTLFCEVDFDICNVKHILQKSTGCPVFLSGITPEEFVTMMDFLRECFSDCKIQFSEYLYERHTTNS